MDISAYVDEYARKRRYYNLPCNAEAVHNLIKSDKEFAFIQQEDYSNSEYLAYNIKSSVQAYSRNKDIAIHVYRDFLKFLKEKNVDVSVPFPPISISNSFERLMFIAKYLQDPRHKVTDLPDLLWVSQRTINDDIKRLRGDHEDPIQVCGKIFIIDEMEKHKDTVYFPSTAHPLFLTPNLTQVLVTLKGLKSMADDPLYAGYAQSVATDIWEQLSDYAKTRIHFVLSELLPEDLSWYESLRKPDDEHFYSEVRCSGSNVVLDCMKNGKTFCIEYEGKDGSCFYKQCSFIPRSYDGSSIEVNSATGCVRLYLDKIIRSAYKEEELM